MMMALILALKGTRTRENGTLNYKETKQQTNTLNKANPKTNIKCN